MKTRSLINSVGSFLSRLQFLHPCCVLWGAGLCHSCLNSACFNQSFYLTREGLTFRNSHPLFPPLSKGLQARICLEWSGWTCARNLLPLAWSLSSLLMLNGCSQGHKIGKHILYIISVMGSRSLSQTLYWNPWCMWKWEQTCVFFQ